MKCFFAAKSAKCEKERKRVKSDYINADGFKIMLDLMERDNANAVRVSLSTGLRIGDVLALRRDNVAPSGELRTICDKTEKPFFGKISKALAVEILQRAGEKSEWVFPSPSPRRLGKPRTRQAVWRDLKNAAKLCATPRNISPHTARKIFAVDQFRKNGLEATKEALQHDRTNTTLLYAFSDLLTDESAARLQPCGARKRNFSDNEILSAFVEAFGGEAEVCKCLQKFLHNASAAQN